LSEDSFKKQIVKCGKTEFRFLKKLQSEDSFSHEWVKTILEYILKLF